ncbi:hypothetical protein [Tropicimonas sediminicola]|uniref:DUF1127 domain-containing protein n=1 Tax=Tropicimonas sediminicola TaxID=1031541 RepID=A0A239FSX5_9RHOB|nr:hypothetical protein [Tropicimonas sediminicola]SNS58984.1 hypothetical protein SAMN05421757_102786 [Tropicimonas sediminicola]
MFLRKRRMEERRETCLPWRVARHLSPEQLRDVGLKACPGPAPVFLRHLW